MAMLAGPRRKQKVINLRAKNSAWSNDANKFGQRMLEKMGWSSGKGLGANEDGIVEHVIARYKNDDRGLGFEDKNDQWTKHEDDFNSLLANLSNSDSHTDQLTHSGVSLEVKSKKSKARVHYHKYTRGKDLTRYSEKDLANIFGKKSLKTNETEDKSTKDDIENPESSQVFTEKGSMEDYFKSKLAALKSKKVNIPETYSNNDDEEADFVFRGFAGTSNNVSKIDDQQDSGFQGFSFYKPPTETNSVDNDDTVVIKKSKKKKSKKQKLEKEECENLDSVNVLNSDINMDQKEVESLEKVKKSKKKKTCDDVYDDADVPKKKKNKLKTIQTEQIVEHIEEDTYVPKKKKKRKSKDVEN